MPRESVVDALNAIHRALRPNGILLDLHPTDAPSPVGAILADRTTRSLGETHFGGDFPGNVAAAEQALAQQQTDGHYLSENEAEFDFLHHFTAESWNAYLTAQFDDYLPLGDELTNGIQQTLADPANLLTLSEHIKATRYRAKR